MFDERVFKIIPKDERRVLSRMGKLFQSGKFARLLKAESRNFRRTIEKI